MPLLAQISAIFLSASREPRDAIQVFTDTMVVAPHEDFVKKNTNYPAGTLTVRGSVITLLTFPAGLRNCHSSASLPSLKLAFDRFGSDFLAARLAAPPRVVSCASP
jgi:hypothetical protein